MAHVEWFTSIADVRSDDIIVRGHRLSDLIGQASYIEMVFLLLRGDLPVANESRMLDAIMVSVVDHGISPSSVLARTLASCGTPLQASLAGSMLSIADWHGGSGEELARLLAETLELTGAEEGDLSATCEHIVDSRRRAGQMIPGFGHPQHPEGDPRAAQLLDLASQLGVRGRHCHLLAQLGACLAQSTGRPSLMRPNITGAMAALLLDLGFPWQSFRGFVIAARSFGLTAHVLEELAQGSRWRHPPGSVVEYTGAEPEEY